MHCFHRICSYSYSERWLEKALVFPFCRWRNWGFPWRKGSKRETTHKLYLSPPIVVTSWVTNKKLTWIAVLFLYLWLPTPTTQPPPLPLPLAPTCLSLATSHSTRGVASLANEDIWVHIGEGNEHMFSTRNCIQHLVCIDWSHSPGKW